MCAELASRAAEVGAVTIKLLEADAGARTGALAIGGELRGWSFYPCGPEPMAAAVREGLVRQGVPARQVHSKEFDFR